MPHLKLEYVAHSSSQVNKDKISPTCLLRESEMILVVFILNIYYRKMFTAVTMLLPKKSHKVYMPVS
jgi:predicted RND superfamily exporter protein